MTQAFPDLDRRHFDVVVIGGGIIGSSALQNCAAAGYSCLLVERSDYATGATGRSSRMLHVGLRYFDAQNPVRHYLFKPSRFMTALSMARKATREVSAFLRETPERVPRYKMVIPVYRGDATKDWHVRLGLWMLESLGDGQHSLNVQRVTRDFEKTIPLARYMRDASDIVSLHTYAEYKFDYPERFCLNMLEDARRKEAVTRNYCAAKLVSRDGEGRWKIRLTDPEDASAAPAYVTASQVLNMAGPWIDEIYEGAQKPKRLIQGTKGTNLAVRFPDEFIGYGINARASNGGHIYVLPMHGNLFTIGVTETYFEGDATGVRPTEDEITHLLDETNRILPGLGLKRSDVEHAWSGVRPLQYDPNDRMGQRARVLHDLGPQGFPGVHAMTAGPIMTHRSAGREALAAIAASLKPSRGAKKVDYSARMFPDDPASPAIDNALPEIREADLRRAVTAEQARSLADVLIRRTGLAWKSQMTAEKIARAADIVAEAAAWSPERKAQEIARFTEQLKSEFKFEL